MSNCSICLSSIETFTVLKCGHVFHNECIIGWSDKSDACPNCRSLMINGDNTGEFFDLPKKIKELEEINLIKELKIINLEKEKIKQEIENKSNEKWIKQLNDELHNSRNNECTYQCRRQKGEFGRKINEKNKKLDEAESKINKLLKQKCSSGCGGQLIKMNRYIISLTEFLSYASPNEIFKINLYNDYLKENPDIEPSRLATMKEFIIGLNNSNNSILINNPYKFD